MASRERDKALKRAENKDKRPMAIAKHIRISSLKNKVVLDLIRGKAYNEAVSILKNTRKSGCEPILKVLESAGANAENNLGIAKDTTFVAECYATAGPTLKRMQPVSKGRGHKILKRTSHITVILDTVPEKNVPAKKVATKTAVKKEVAKTTTTKTAPKTTTTKTAEAKPAVKKVAVKKEAE